MTMTLTQTISSAYDVSSLLRVCIRSLEGGAADQVGDGGATAHTVKLASDMADDLITALERLEETANRGMRDNSHADGAAKLFGQWQNAHTGRDAVLKALGPKHLDDPEQLVPIDELIGRLGEQIASSAPQSDADAAAMLQWCVEDCAGECFDPDYPKAQLAVIAYLRKKGAEA
ncbi:hypothetical protein JQX09_24560 [Sulfitobacter pseudonitzschiae]|uniref:Uncharacterized protein n=1 Tax=Pseudosulfitobacter pseudonitzschiae TaxID=1402135 RepID=A0A9Q2NTW0_9RHOB|nr:hypothetical protein [Pseudosulfitobacter pseudonitzschiae]MBM2295092.1 hypothetical protein [Pseudosulfitobacter pseudonitzschiae]MBM2300029.1 hypothetical protein [Pseudosulfitobacter pseudonitzschiae]MBM2304930.1 hypothetical protein [Pseudosulfitobacter pseudonitzschiae]MBM2314703.1 hypothetical protein [Pseudosulfitobacter pseudonitzschiae]MBM2319611.1 hypothetical protein [Pseudosulfitobacter pseudonitzschiae]